MLVLGVVRGSSMCKIPEKLRWFAGDIQARYENYRTNLFTIINILLVWWLVTWLKVAMEVGLQTIPADVEESDRWILAILVFPLGWLLFTLSSPVSQSPVIGIALLLTCLIYLYVVCDPISLVEPSQAPEFGKELAGIWHWTVAIAALWLLFISVRTLNAVFRHHRVKLLQFWYWFIGNLIFISGAYSLHSSIGLIAALILPHVRHTWLTSNSGDDVFRRGRKIFGIGRATVTERKALQSGGESFFNGGVKVPLAKAKTHVMTVGTTGSGKSVTTNKHMADILQLVKKGTNRRALVYDAKNVCIPDIYGILDSSLDTEVAILNPKDHRAVAIDIAAEIDFLSDIQMLVSIFIPPPSHGERAEKFWLENPRQILQAALEWLHLNKPKQWTLRDVIEIFKDEETYKAIVGSDRRTKYALGLLASSNTNANIFSSVRTDVYKFRPLAARWEHTTRKISLKQWVKEGGTILVLGRDIVRGDATTTATAVLNRFVMTRLTQLLLSQPDVDDPSTFLFFDELHTIHIDLVDLATQGRSKGVCLFVAFQSIQSLNQFYGSDGVETVLGQFGLKNFLLLSDVPTAEWCSKLIGEAEITRANISYDWLEDGGILGHGKKNAFTTQTQTHRIVMPSELTSMPPINIKNNIGMTGYYLGSELYKHTYSVQELKKLFISKDPSQPDFIPILPDWEILEPWGARDFARLGITQIMEQMMLKQNKEGLEKSLSQPDAVVVTADEDEIEFAPPLLEADEDEDEIGFGELGDDAIAPDTGAPNQTRFSSKGPKKEVPPKQPRRSNSMFGQRERKQPPGR